MDNPKVCIAMAMRLGSARNVKDSFISAGGMLNSITAIWLSCGILAVFMLVKMMRSRQLYLIDLLKAHVEIQAAWARRRDRALEIAAAEQAEIERQKAKVVKIVNEITSQSEAG
jgi:hypothetical protein